MMNEEGSSDLESSRDDDKSKPNRYKYIFDKLKKIKRSFKWRNPLLIETVRVADVEQASQQVIEEIKEVLSDETRIDDAPSPINQDTSNFPIRRDTLQLNGKQKNAKMFSPLAKCIIFICIVVILVSNILYLYQLFINK